GKVEGEDQEIFKVTFTPKKDGLLNVFVGLKSDEIFEEEERKLQNLEAKKNRTISGSTSTGGDEKKKEEKIEEAEEEEFDSLKNRKLEKHKQWLRNQTSIGIHVNPAAFVNLRADWEDHLRSV